MEKCICGNKVKPSIEFKGNRRTGFFKCSECKKEYMFVGTDEEILSQFKNYVKDKKAILKNLDYADCQIIWGLTVECPHCGQNSELSDDDKNGIFSKPIFNGRKDDLHNMTVKCQHINDCGKNFLIDKVKL